MKNPKKLIWQLYPPYLLLVFVALLAIGWYASRAMQLSYITQIRKDLTHQADLLKDQFAPLLAKGDFQAIDRLCKERGKSVPSRLTVILPNGVVAGDSETDPRQMENHGDRPEIRNALQGPRGSATRFSGTLRQRMLYVALPIQPGQETLGIMRVSIATNEIDQQLQTLRTKLIVGGLIIAVLAAFVCLAISRRISSPLETMRQSAAKFAQGDLSHRIAPPATIELADLAGAMNRMAKELERRIATVVQQRNESRAVLSSLTEGVVALDPEEHILHLNRAAEGLLNQSREKVQGRSIQEIIRNHELHTMIKTTLTERTKTQGDVVLYHDGEQILNTRCMPLLDAGGDPMGALLVISDVTQLRRLEHMRRDFAANVSHEIKTPLTAIQGFVETLYHGAVENPQEAQRFLEIIHNHVKRLTAIIDDLLKLSRLEQDADTGRLHMEPASVKNMMDTAVGLCTPKAREKNISIDITVESGLSFAMDSELMEQAAVNLLDNAIKYSPEDSRIEVNAQKQENEIRIAFHDQGIGIPQKHLPRLFERFYRVDKARSRKMGGTGLGLAIVKHIIQAHGGRITIESTQGKGSTFTIHIPQA